MHLGKLCFFAFLKKIIYLFYGTFYVLPWWSSGKESPANAGDGVQSLVQEDPLEKEMATISSILALETPWTEEPGWLQYMGLKKSWAWCSI